MKDNTFRGAQRHGVGPLTIAAAATAVLGLGAANAQTLPTWDDYTDVNQAAVITELNNNFAAAHPGVTLNRTARTFEDLSLTLKLAVSSGDGPIVTKVNQGAAEQGAMAKQGLLVPVDAYAAELGWDERQPEGLLARSRWSDEGQFGQGKLYGVSGLGEIVGLYYNAKVLADAGIAEPPESFEDLLADVETLKAAGQIPFVIGTAGDFFGIHMFASVEQAHIDASERAALDDVVYGRGGTFKTDAGLKAAAAVQNWATSGAFIDGYQGITGDDAVQLFVAGSGAFLVSGTWQFAAVEQNPDIHFMAMPAPEGVTKPLSVGGVDLSWSVTTNAKDEATQKLAAEYLDYMISAEAATIWAKAGFFPSTTLSDPSVVSSPVLAEGLEMWKVLGENNAVGHYPDWASPTLLKTYEDNLPLLFAGNLTPEAFVELLDADYQAYLASK